MCRLALPLDWLVWLCSSGVRWCITRFYAVYLHRPAASGEEFPLRVAELAGCQLQLGGDVQRDPHPLRTGIPHNDAHRALQVSLPARRGRRCDWAALNCGF